MRRAGVALGSNLGDRRKNLLGGLRAVRALHCGGPLLLSRVHETEPVGCPEGSGRFLNAVMEISWDGTAEALLEALEAAERGMGRIKERERNAPRVIDLDLLYVGELQSDRPGLRLPHPKMGEREFVLRPLAEIRPELILPGHRETVIGMLRARFVHSSSQDPPVNKEN